MCKLEILFVFTLICHVVLGAVITKDSPATIILEQCEGKKDMPIMFNNISFKRSSATTHELNGQIIVNEPITEGNFKVNVHGKVCSLDEADSCEAFSTEEIMDYCDLLAADEDPVTIAFFKHINIPKKCPIAKGTYTISKFEIDDEEELPNVMTNLTVETYKMDPKEVEMSCVVMHGNL